MAQGDIVSIEANTASTAYDFIPSSGVEWCITSLWSTSNFSLKSITNNSHAYAFGTNSLEMRDGNSKIFVANGTNQRLRVNANSSWQTVRITGIVTKE